MHVDTMVFGALTLLMTFGSIVMILGVVELGNLAVIVGGALLVLGIMLLAYRIAIIDEPEHADTSASANELAHAEESAHADESGH